MLSQGEVAGVLRRVYARVTPRNGVSRHIVAGLLNGATVMVVAAALAGAGYAADNDCGVHQPRSRAVAAANPLFPPRVAASYCALV